MNVTKLHSSDALTRLSEIQFIDRLGPEEAALCIDAITTNLRHAVRLCEEMRKRSDDQVVLNNLYFLANRMSMLAATSEQTSMEIASRHIIFGGA